MINSNKNRKKIMNIKNSSFIKLLPRYILSILVLTISFRSMAMQEQNNIDNSNRILSLKELALNCIYDQIKKQVQTLPQSSSSEEIENKIVHDWLNVNILPQDLINDIKDKIYSKTDLTNSYDCSLNTLEYPKGNSIFSMDSMCNVISRLKDNKIVAGGVDGLLIIWDFKNNRVLINSYGYTGQINAIAELENGDIVTGSENGRIDIWDSITGKHLKGMVAHKGSINFIKILPNGAIASGSSDAKIKIFDPITYRCLDEIDTDLDDVRFIETLKNNKIIVSVAYDNKIKLWHKDRGLQVLLDHNNMICDIMALSEDMFLSSSRDNTLRIWSISEEYVVECKHILKLNEKNLVFSHNIKVLNNNIIAVVCERTIQLWDIISGKKIAVLKGHKGYVFFIILLSDNLIASYSPLDETIRVWDIGRLKCINIIHYKDSVIAMEPYKDLSIIALFASGKMIVYRSGARFQDKLLNLRMKSL